MSFYKKYLKYKNKYTKLKNKYNGGSQFSMATHIGGSGEGSSEGSGEGSSVGSVVGSSVGSVVGSVEGSSEGSVVGSSEGSVVGSSVGSVVGSSEGSGEGSVVGSSEGSGEGSALDPRIITELMLFTEVNNTICSLYLVDNKIKWTSGYFKQNVNSSSLITYYLLNLYDILHITNLDHKIIDRNRFVTPVFQNNIPYVFIPNIFIDNISNFRGQIDLINDLVSTNFLQYIVMPLYLNWFKITAIKNLSISHTIRQNGKSIQPIIWFGNLTPNERLDLFKVHVNVKVEYIFWTIEKILRNLNKFIYQRDKSMIIKGFKFNGNLSFIKHFSHTLKYPDQRLQERDINIESISSENYNVQLSPSKEILLSNYKYENITDANIVFYLSLDNETTEILQKKNQNKIRQLIHTLMLLFPDNLNIGSPYYPRFNFKANDSVFFAFGNGDHKENLKNNSFSAVDDINDCDDTSVEQCQELNDTMHPFFGKEMCRIVETDSVRSCTKNNLLSLEKMIYKVNERKKEGLSLFNLPTLRIVYEYVGLDYRKFFV
jgi:hypothetical protein